MLFCFCACFGEIIFSVLDIISVAIVVFIIVYDNGDGNDNGG